MTISRIPLTRATRGWTSALRTRGRELSKIMIERAFLTSLHLDYVHVLTYERSSEEYRMTFSMKRDPSSRYPKPYIQTCLITTPHYSTELRELKIIQMHLHHYSALESPPDLTPSATIPPPTSNNVSTA
jgi:hypothetical protein